MRRYRGLVASAPSTTVVIPVWDRYVDRITEAVASIRAQDVPHRIVIVDNASSVPVPELEGVELVRCPRRLSLGRARDRGLAAVGTAYVVCFDADDVMLPGTLARLEAAITADPRLVAYGTAILEGPSGRTHRWPRRWIARLSRAERLFALLHSVWSLYATTGATVMRTDLAQQSGGFPDSDAGEDWVLGVSMAFRGRVGWSLQPGRIYRLHADSVTARGAGARELARRARTVRERIRVDPGIPGWARAAIAVIAAAQHTAIALHLAWAIVRRLRARASGGAPERSRSQGTRQGDDRGDPPV